MLHSNDVDDDSEVITRQWLTNNEMRNRDKNNRKIKKKLITAKNWRES